MHSKGLADASGDCQPARVGDLIKSGILMVSDGYRVRNEELGRDGIPFVRGGDIRGGWIDCETFDRIRPEFASRVQAKLAQPGDVAFIIKGTVGRAGRLVSGQPPVVFAPQVSYWRVLDKQTLDPDFLYYLVQGHAFQSALDGVKTHGAMVADYVSISQQHDFVLALPPIAVQRSAAAILNSLENKIELNRRMCETLDAIARALFKSWFVDFEPVRANSEGRDTGLSAEISALFPDSFVQSALGEVPAEWTASKVGEHLITVLGGTPSKANAAFWTGGGIAWINSGKVNDFRITIPTAYITAEALQRSAAKLLPARTTVLAITGATLGQVSLLEIPAAANQSVIGILESATIPSEYIYHWIKERIGELVNRQTGGAQQHVNKNDVNDMPLLVPPDNVMAAYLDITGPIFDRIKVANIETQTLRALRDLLLPKLISGELRASDAEPMVDEAIPA